MDIVWFAEIKWDYLRTRKQQIIRRKPDNVRLLFLEPYVKGRDNDFSVREDDGILRVTIPFIKSVPDRLVRTALDSNVVRNVIDKWALRRVRGAIGHAGLDAANLGLIISNIYAVRVARRVPGRFLLYDCNDAHNAFPGMPGWTTDYFQETSARADFVYASARALVDDVAKARGNRDGIALLGNGVDFDWFHSQDGGGEVPAERPVIGYLGAIAPWLDFGSLEALARAHADWEVRLVGPVLGGADGSLERLTSLPNVTYGEPVPHEEVPSIVSRFTVGVIPFRYDDLTRGVNPNKMYEYLAMGVPVVTTRFSHEVTEYPDVVYATEPGKPFVEACEALVCARRDNDKRGIIHDRSVQIARDHDWSVIAESFWRQVELLHGG